MTTEVTSVTVQVSDQDRDADGAYARLRAARVAVHDDEVLRMAGMPPTIHVADPNGNGLMYLEEVGH